ncbi:hypothetical protein OC845_005236 [Tilletia horrida]|nr:hypothetical protein OC845_005236 [Tilletia horrida]
MAAEAGINTGSIIIGSRRQGRALHRNSRRRGLSALIIILVTLSLALVANAAAVQEAERTSLDSAAAAAAAEQIQDHQQFPQTQSRRQRSNTRSAVSSFFELVLDDILTLFSLPALDDSQLDPLDFGWEPDAGGNERDLFNFAPAGSNLIVVRSQASYLTRSAAFGPHIVEEEGLRGNLLPIELFYRPPQQHSPEALTGQQKEQEEGRNRGCPYPNGPGWKDQDEDEHHHGGEAVLSWFKSSSAGSGSSSAPTDTKNLDASTQKKFVAALRPPRNWIALVERGTCSFVSKVRVAQALGAFAVVIGDAPSPAWSAPSPPPDVGRHGHPPPKSKLDPLPPLQQEEGDQPPRKEGFWAWLKRVTGYDALRELLMGPMHSHRHQGLINPDENVGADPGQSNKRLVTMYGNGDTSDILIPSTFVTRPSYLDLVRLIDEIEHEQKQSHTAKKLLEDGDDEDGDSSPINGLEIILERDEIIWEWPLIDFAIFLLLLPSIMTFGTVIIHRIRLARQRRKDRAPEVFVSSLPCYIWRGGGVPWEKIEGDDPPVEPAVSGSTKAATVEGEAINTSASSSRARQTTGATNSEVGTAGPSTSHRASGYEDVDLEAGGSKAHADSASSTRPLLSKSRSVSNDDVRGNMPGSASTSSADQTTNEVAKKRLSKAAASQSFDFLPPGRSYYGTVECAICLDNFADGDYVRILPCGHCFHRAEVDEWLCKVRKLCPVCKRDCTVEVPEWVQRNEMPSSSTQAPGTTSTLSASSPLERTQSATGDGSASGTRAGRTGSRGGDAGDGVDILSLADALDDRSPGTHGGR